MLCKHARLALAPALPLSPGMLKALSLSLLLLTGCDEILGSNDDVNVGSGEPQLLRPLLGKQVEPTVGQGCYNNVCPIAAGGATLVPINFNDGTGVVAMMDD